MSTAAARISSVEQLRALLPKTAPEALDVEIISVHAEPAASLHACWDLDLSHSVPVGIEISGSHIRPASDGHILAKASVVRRSSKLAVHTVEIVHEESGRLLCLSRVTNYYKEIPPVQRT